MSSALICRLVLQLRRYDCHPNGTSVSMTGSYCENLSFAQRKDEEFNFFKNPVIGVVSATNNDEARLSAAVEYTNSISDIHPLDLHYPVLRAPVDIELGLLVHIWLFLGLPC